MKFSVLFSVLLAFTGLFISAPTLAGGGNTPAKKVTDDSLVYTVTPPIDSVAYFAQLWSEYEANYLNYIPNEPNELIEDRLSCMETTIPLHFNNYVRGFVDYFTIRNRKYTRRILERENVYFPLFEKYLAKHDMPQELKYLSVVESALNPKALSHASAMGLWQFIPGTADEFNLKRNEYMDERMDPEKSTEAACRYLKQLYRIFGDWEMALASYNCGPGNVRKAIRRSGGKTTFWEIFPYLPKETRGYVPSFTAVVYAMNYSKEHRLYADSLQYAIEADTILINQGLDLEKFAANIQVDTEVLKKLNPALKKTYLPEYVKNYPLKVPAEKMEVLALNRQMILDSARYIAPVKIIREPAPMLASTTNTDSLQKTYYTVKRGDYMGKIANQYNISLNDLKAWNNLKTNTIVPNQKLIVYQPAPVKPTDKPETTAANTALAQNKDVKDKTEKAEKTVDATETSEPGELTASAQTTPAEETAAETKVKAETPVKVVATQKKASLNAKDVKLPTEKMIHSVQPGDTLWNISRRYEGITVEQIKKLNNLKGNELKPGQKLILG